MFRRIGIVMLALMASTFPLAGRTLSFAPITDRAAFPAMQARTNRFFAVVEAEPPTASRPHIASYGRLVIYDSTGEQPPRVVFPQDGTSTVFTLAAVREATDGVASILIQTSAFSAAPAAFTFYLSTDNGVTWNKVDLPNDPVRQMLVTGVDTGGPYAASRFSPVRIGTTGFPFVVASGTGLYAVNANGTSRLLYQAPPSSSPLALGGSNRDGSSFIIRNDSQFMVVDLEGTVRVLGGGFIYPQPRIEGFIATDGSVYLEELSSKTSSNGYHYDPEARICFFRNGAQTQLFSFTWGYSNAGNPGEDPPTFLLPVADYSGAWIFSRGSTSWPALYKHTPAAGLIKQWQDTTYPFVFNVQAIHAGASGTTLLFQTSRRLDFNGQTHVDPLFALWHVGDMGPATYDAMYVDTQWNRGFIHLDVDKASAGEPFVFDSGSSKFTGNGSAWISPPPPATSGSDVEHYWGVVRASLKQRLILPSIGRLKGEFGSEWATDVIIQNPLSIPQRVKLSLIEGSTGCTGGLSEVTYTLGLHDLRLFPDAMKSIFQRETCTGALLIEPDSGVTVSSRTYTKGLNGDTFGFGMDAVGIFSASPAPSVAATFAGAFAGSDYRTNVSVIDTSGRGSVVSLAAAGSEGLIGPHDASIEAPANGHHQVNGIASAVGLPAYERGALIVAPTAGSAITSVFAIDNRTNDSTYFASDLPRSRSLIPVIGHVDGANNSKFRSDVYLYNPGDRVQTVLLGTTSWDRGVAPASLQLALLPHEARVIKDALLSVFGQTGVARLSVIPVGADSPLIGPDVRVTSRTYNVDPNGGTYGFAVPPLDLDQIGTNQDTMEIVGAIADPQFRVNLALVGWGSSYYGPPKVSVDIIDSTGRRLKTFTVDLLSSTGVLLADICGGVGATGPVLIRLSVAQKYETLWGYATMTDNRTNDSVYLPVRHAAN